MIITVQVNLSEIDLMKLGMLARDKSSVGDEIRVAINEHLKRNEHRLGKVLFDKRLLNKKKK